MADLSTSFNPGLIATNSDAASSALSLGATVSNVASAASSAIAARTDQSVKSAASPTFVGATLTGVVDHDVTLTTTGTAGFDLLTQFNHTANIARADGLRAYTNNISGFGITSRISGLTFITIQNGTGLIAEARGITGSIDNTSTGDITVGRVIYAAPPTISSSGTITTLTGVFIGTQKHASVTTAYGIYQAGASDLNYFAGVTEFVKTVHFHACQTATGDGTTTINWSLGNKFYFTFGAQNDTFTFTAPDGPCNLVLVLKQDGTGGRTATWPGTVMWPSGTAPTLSTGAAAIDIICFFYDGTNYFGQLSLNFSVPA